MFGSLQYGVVPNLLQIAVNFHTQYRWIWLTHFGGQHLAHTLYNYFIKKMMYRQIQFHIGNNKENVIRYNNQHNSN